MIVKYLTHRATGEDEIQSIYGDKNNVIINISH